MGIKRVVPCLDVNKGKVVKGVKFVDLVDVGDPSEIAAYYCEQGADELVFLDITATSEDRETIVDVVRRTAKHVSVPLAVGGGIRTVDDFARLMDAGASKLSINSAAINRPGLIDEAAKKFGSESVVVAIDAKRAGDGYQLVVSGGKLTAEGDVVEWAVEAYNRGAGEILLTSMDMDGTKAGYDIELTRRVADAVGIPVVASGGAGTLEHFYDAIENGHADAVLAASLFHFREIEIPQLKKYLAEKGVSVRL